MYPNTILLLHPLPEIIVNTFLTKELYTNSYKTVTEYKDEKLKGTPPVNKDITEVLENKILAHEYYLKLR